MTSGAAVLHRYIIIIFLLLTACTGPDKPPVEPTMTTSPTINSIETIISDMQPPHDEKPHGVPESYDWATGPRLGYGSDPGDFRAIIPWGQVYECASGNTATNTRVHLRGLSLYILSKRTGEWQEVQRNAPIRGAAYREDFKEDLNKPASERLEPEGGLSITAGEGYNYHFFSERESIDPEDIAGVFSSVQARLVTNDSQESDDRDQACYLLSMGADYWRDLSAPWKADFSNNGDVAIGKFKRITSEWQAFNMTTLSTDDLLHKPPPIE
jgi:hypothetical protein